MDTKFTTSLLPVILPFSVSPFLVSLWLLLTQIQNMEIIEVGHSLPATKYYQAL